MQIRLACIIVTFSNLSDRWNLTGDDVLATGSSESRIVPWIIL